MATSFLDKKKPSLEKQCEALTPLIQQLKSCSLAEEKLGVLNNWGLVKEFLKKPSPLRTFLSGLSPECEVVIKSLVAIGQAGKIFSFPVEGALAEKMRELLEKFLEVERFYEEMGGIVGYHWMTLKLLCLQNSPTSSGSIEYQSFQGIDISSESLEVKRAIAWGIKNMEQMAEIYPVGGAADRLRLHDEVTGIPLPASKLLFAGKTLLEGLIADLQAREYLHYKLMGKQVTTPVAMMTSQEKDNHAKILGLCVEKGWFGRPQGAFKFFCQPSVPVMNKEGSWIVEGNLQPLFKPGGHGVIWKLARDEGVFDWLFSQKRKKALVRQINNPIAGTDYGLIAFTGLGCKMDKAFGFASCPRQTRAMEGINVLVEKKESDEFSYLLTNIEYCDFKKFNIVDEPVSHGSAYSKFPSNTNILFADLEALLKAVVRTPIPGMLVNVKKIAYQTEKGEVEEEIARLESTMQNIADAFAQTFDKSLKVEERDQLQTFLTYNERRKTISTAKRGFVLGSSLLETPEGCFLDLLKNAREILLTCQFEVPEVNDAASFMVKGPTFLFLYHPALGPLYSVIAQKLRKGSLSIGSELQLEIVDLDCENLEVEGSLCITATSILGDTDSEGVVKYSNQTGKCTLKNVKVSNAGIDRTQMNVFWKNAIYRKESCHILLHGNAEFYAQDVVLSGNHLIEVESGMRCIAEHIDGKLHIRKEPIAKPTWVWNYSFGEDEGISLVRENL
jgi:hypothetical protein